MHGHLADLPFMELTDGAEVEDAVRTPRDMDTSVDPLDEELPLLSTEQEPTTLVEEGPLVPEPLPLQIGSEGMAVGQLDFTQAGDLVPAAADFPPHVPHTPVGFRGKEPHPAQASCQHDNRSHNAEPVQNQHLQQQHLQQQHLQQQHLQQQQFETGYPTPLDTDLGMPLAMGGAANPSPAMSTAASAMVRTRSSRTLPSLNSGADSQREMKVARQMDYMQQQQRHRCQQHDQYPQQHPPARASASAQVVRRLASMVELSAQVAVVSATPVGCKKEAMKNTSRPSRKRSRSTAGAAGASCKAALEIVNAGLQKRTRSPKPRACKTNGKKKKIAECYDDDEYEEGFVTPPPRPTRRNAGSRARSGSESDSSMDSADSTGRPCSRRNSKWTSGANLRLMQEAVWQCWKRGASPKEQAAKLGQKDSRTLRRKLRLCRNGGSEAVVKGVDQATLLRLFGDGTEE